MATKMKISVGDVFQIPIDSARVGYGQVVLRPEAKVNGVLFICVYAETSRPEETPDIGQIIQSEILLAGSTFDAKLSNGDWPIVGNLVENLPRIALPTYKYGMGDDAVVETLDRTRCRRATPEEELVLTFRTYTAPIGFELALKAIAGIGEWRDAFDSLNYELLRKSSGVIV